MSFSVCLFAAACVAATPPDAPAPMPPGLQTIQPIPADAPPPASSPRLFGRIRNLFSRRSEPRDGGVSPVGATTGATGSFQPGMPMARPGEATRPGHALSEKDLEKAGHEKDYTWITGRVFRADGGRWVLRYAGPHEVDRYEGSVLLSPKPGMPALMEGDLVCVHGKVTGSAPRTLAGASYDPSEINVIEHAKR
jgi:hypothetical protein